MCVAEKEAKILIPISHTRKLRLRWDQGLPREEMTVLRRTSADKARARGEVRARVFSKGGRKG